MKPKKEIVIFPLLFLAAIWLTDTFWPGPSAIRSFPEDKKIMKKKVIKSESEWKKILSPEQFRVMRKAGTEKPFTGKYNDHYEKGMYFCAGCGTPLFLSDTKYDHGTGWPSFTAPVDEENIHYTEDLSLLMKRIEVTCAICGAHLGHVFDDGPPPSGQHFCINSIALNFGQVATFAAGCFWGVEDKFSKIQGVVQTTVGYTGGTVDNPTYKLVCSGNTGHAEAVHILYDPDIVSYSELVDVFFQLHDPTQLNRQGPDIGTQYRSAIFYHSEDQKKEAEKAIKKREESGRFQAPIMTQIGPASKFFPAEEYHQKFYQKLAERRK
jgi:peptide methionine sulfoxide reductase msrA/msrB